MGNLANATGGIITDNGTANSSTVNGTGSQITTGNSAADAIINANGGAVVIDNGTNSTIGASGAGNKSHRQRGRSANVALTSAASLALNGGGNVASASGGAVITDNFGNNTLSAAGVGSVLSPPMAPAAR